MSIAGQAEQRRAGDIGRAILALVADMIPADAVPGSPLHDQSLGEAILVAAFIALTEREAHMPSVVCGLGLTLGSYAAQLPTGVPAVLHETIIRAMLKGQDDATVALTPQGRA